MDNVSRRTFATISAAVAATAVAPAFANSRLAARDDTLQSELLVDLTLDTLPAHQIGAVGGGRLVVPVSGGTFEGPRLKGTIISPGGDWILERPDGSRVLDVRILLQTDDAQTIYVSWRGIAYTPPGGELFARILPVFETGAARYAWLNNVVAVGVYRGGGKISYRIYRIL
jgi:hypothetical protein